MADPEFFPGFDGEDAAKKPASQPPQSTPKPKPGFDAFADVAVKPPSPGEAPPAAAAPAAAPAPVRPPVAAAPAAPAQAQPTDEDAALQPGSRKDLWKCPHCGAGNKPDRNTCRACGKSPDEAVSVPWYRNHLIRAGIAAALLVLVFLTVRTSQVDLEMREPGPQGLDAKAPRIGGSSDATGSASAGIRFIGESRISVSGRVVATKSAMGMTWIALALAPAAADDEAFAALEATPSGAGFDFDDGCVLACIFDDKIDLQPGFWLSLAGSTGDLVKEGTLLREAEGATPVLVESYLIKKP